jgi:hypothetical protein
MEKGAGLRTPAFQGCFHPGGGDGLIEQAERGLFELFGREALRCTRFSFSTRQRLVPQFERQSVLSARRHRAYELTRVRCGVDSQFDVSHPTLNTSSAEALPVGAGG